MNTRKENIYYSIITVILLALIVITMVVVAPIVVEQQLLNQYHSLQSRIENYDSLEFIDQLKLQLDVLQYNKRIEQNNDRGDQILWSPRSEQKENSNK